MAREPRKKATPAKTPEEALRLKEGILRLAEGMLDDNTQNYALAYLDNGGIWHMSCSDRTWGMGAARRMALDLEEGRPSQERED